MNGSNDARPESEDECLSLCTGCRELHDYSLMTAWPTCAGRWYCETCIVEVSQ